MSLPPYYPDNEKPCVLTLNAGSSSIKFSLFELDATAPALVGQIDGIGAKPHIKAKDGAGNKLDDVDLDITGSQERQHHQALLYLVKWLRSHGEGWKAKGVGHRVVHGGEKYAAPVLLTPEIRRELASFVSLAPLHQPHNLDGIDAIGEILPDVPQIACFDTAFHRSQPALAQTFALPRALTDEGVKRYGFHGLSYEFIARSLPAHTDRADGRVAVAHLGNGSSMAAMVGRKSVASTMGFTAVDGLMMGTRTGNLDPGVVLYLLDEKKMDAAAITKLLYKQSGLLGVSGISQDMRELLASDHPHAKEAVDLFCYRISRELGSLAAAAGGLDVLVFTAGIGEHAAPVREQVCAQAAWLGIKLDREANNAPSKLPRRISAPDSAVEVLVLPTDEEWMIAHHTQRLLGL